MRFLPGTFGIYKSRENFGDSAEIYDSDSAALLHKMCVLWEGNISTCVCMRAHLWLIRRTAVRTAWDPIIRMKTPDWPESGERPFPIAQWTRRTFVTFPLHYYTKRERAYKINNIRRNSIPREKSLSGKNPLCGGENPRKYQARSTCVFNNIEGRTRLCWNFISISNRICEKCVCVCVETTKGHDNDKERSFSAHVEADMYRWGKIKNMLKKCSVGRIQAGS